MSGVSALGKKVADGRCGIRARRRFFGPAPFGQTCQIEDVMAVIVKDPPGDDACRHRAWKFIADCHSPSRRRTLPGRGPRAETRRHEEFNAPSRRRPPGRGRPADTQGLQPADHWQATAFGSSAGRPAARSRSKARSISDRWFCFTDHQGGKARRQAWPHSVSKGLTIASAPANSGVVSGSVAEPRTAHLGR